MPVLGHSYTHSLDHAVVDSGSSVRIRGNLLISYYMMIREFVYVVFVRAFNRLCHDMPNSQCIPTRTINLITYIISI